MLRRFSRSSGYMSLKYEIQSDHLGLVLEVFLEDAKALTMKILY